MLITTADCRRSNQNLETTAGSGARTDYHPINLSTASLSLAARRETCSNAVPEARPREAGHITLRTVVFASIAVVSGGACVAGCYAINKMFPASAQSPLREILCAVILYGALYAGSWIGERIRANDVLAGKGKIKETPEGR